MKVTNITSNKGNPVPNQFIINWTDGSTYDYETFQSYDSNIVEIATKRDTGSKFIYLDKNYWDYSVTTGKYRNQFLNETKKETQAKIDSGEYMLTNLNEV